MYNSDEIIDLLYPAGDPAREIFLKHSIQVRNKALEIAEKFPEADIELICHGAMLHDIGIRFCHAPNIGCNGEADYLLHGITGAEKLRSMAVYNSEKLARICERHTGSGLTAQEIIAGKLPLPPRDLLPETLEEKIICLADKFFSKSGRMEEKSLEKIRRGMEKFGTSPLKRFDELCAELLETQV